MKGDTFIALWAQLFFCLFINPVITYKPFSLVFFSFFLSHLIFSSLILVKQKKTSNVWRRVKSRYPLPPPFTETGCPVETLFLKNKIFRVFCQMIFFMRIVSEKMYLLFNYTFTVIEMDFLILLYENALIVILSVASVIFLHHFQNFSNFDSHLCTLASYIV